MTPHSNKPKHVFERAIEFSSSDDREKYLDQICGDDVDLRSQVEELLKAYDAAGSFLDEPNPALAISDSELNIENTQIGPYKLREQIGEGGMGVVYVAEQSEPVQRKIALKIIKPGMDTKEVIARFEAERQALAFMEHPNIARVLDAGATESGRSYFVMELVRGIPITEYCDQLKATPRERLELFKTVCDAVQHAHQKGIIHRDIKPSNVLVTQVGSQPIVKVIDFGLAKATSGQKLTDKTVYTGFMKLMGTPSYMSPEQAGLSGLDVDTRSDVYSLGVLLYELLTGTTPLDKSEIQKQAYDELCRQICEVEAPKPSSRVSTLKDAERSAIAQQRQLEPTTLRRLLDGDLDVVILKTLEKDRDRRYGTPQELSADIDRFLSDKPVQAVPPSHLYLARKYMRRHKAGIVTAATILTLLVTATAISTWLAFRATRAERIAGDRLVAANDAKDQAENARIVGRRELYVNTIQLADQIWNSPNGTLRQVEDLLAPWIPVDDQSDLREFSWRYQWTQIHQGAQHTVRNTMTATISDSGYLITTGDSGVRQWDKSGRLVADCWDGDASQAILSPDGRWLAIPDGESTQLIDLQPSSGSDLVSSQQNESRSRMHQLPGTRLTFSPDSQLLACWGSEGEIAIWRIGEGLLEAAAPLRVLEAERLPQQGNLALSSDGESYIVKGVARIGKTNQDAIALLSGREKPVICQRNNSPLGACAWAADGSLFAVGNLTGKIHLYRATDPENSIVLRSHGKQITAITFSSDGTKLASGGSDGTIDIWEFAAHEASPADSPASKAKSVPSAVITSTEHARGPGTPRLLRSIKATVDPVRSIAFSPDGMELASTDESGLSKRWHVRNGEAEVRLDDIAPQHYRAGVGIDVDVDDGQTTVASVTPGLPAEKSGRITKGDRILGLSYGANSEVRSVAGKNFGEVEDLLVGPPGTVVRLHFQDSVDNSDDVIELERKSLPERAFRVAFASNGRSLAIASLRGGTLWRIGDRDARRAPASCFSVDYSPDGRLLAMDDRTRVVLWDLEHDRLYAELETGQRGRSMEFRMEIGASLAFSPDGKYLAVGTSFPFNHRPKRSDLVVWDVTQLSESKGESVAGRLLLENEHVFTALSFTPDGQSLVTVDHDGVLRVWNATTWSLQQTVELRRRATAMDLSPDGSTLAIGFGRSLSNKSGIILWDITTGSERQTIRSQRPMGIAFSPDGKTLASTSESHDVVLWDVWSGRQLRLLSGHSSQVFGVAYSKDGTKLATAEADGSLRIWEAAPLDQIDRDPQTLRAMCRLGRTQNQERRYARAKSTLERTLQLQQESPSMGAKEIAQTREQLAIAVQGLEEMVVSGGERPPPQGDSTTALNEPGERRRSGN